ncbi:MAG TPA: hypothetical protein VEZ90_12395 [Blastocatellia bacterium]|nr:hypothetical protein [Blastocatellia bacterium]
MRRVRSIVPIFPCALLFVLMSFAAPALGQTGERVSLEINPTTFRAGQPASAELSLCSVSLTPVALSAGSKFMFIVDSSFGPVQSVASTVAVNSPQLSASDFSVTFAGGSSPVVLTYNGATKSFDFGDSISVKVNLIASVQTGTGKVSFSGPTVSPINGLLPFTTVAIVDFANSGTSAVTHDQSLIGDGTAAMPLGIAPGGVTAADLGISSVTTTAIEPGAVVTFDLAESAVTAGKIASGQVVKTLNGLTDAVSIAGAGGTTITPSGSTLVVTSSVSHDGTLAGSGASTSPLGVTIPVKAMVFINEDGSIGRCYNSTLGGSAATTVPCGFSTSHPALGLYFVIFGFAVDNSFISGTAQMSSTATPTGITVAPAIDPMGNIVPNQERILSYYASNGDSRQGSTNTPFYLIVF